MPRHADVLVANRAYGDHNRPPGEHEVVFGAGGLVAAAGSAVLPWDGQEGTLWIGAGRGPFDHEFIDERGFEILQSGRGPLLHQRLFFDDETWEGHYEQVANSFLWPALHTVRPDLRERAAFFPAPVTPGGDDWASFVRANQAFADAAASSGRESVWVHDYQVALTPLLMREHGFTGAVGFFLHTPFPPMDALLPALDEAGRGRFAEFVSGILGATLAGFQTDRDCERFARAAVEFCGAKRTESGVVLEGRETFLGAFPVGVNADEVLSAAGGDLPLEARGPAASGLPLVVALERADFTKGVPERLAAVERAYDAGARFAYFGSASPTRQGIALYEGLGPVIEVASRRAAAAASRAGCPFVQAQLSLSWPEVVALLGRADVVFTSSLSDGMNLVPLQAAVAQSAAGHRGVMIAGQDAGVAPTFARFEGQGLAIIDPLDTEACAATLVDAVAGRIAPVSDGFAAAVQANDAEAWGDAFLTALEAAHARA